MDAKAIQRYVNDFFPNKVLPTFMNYVRIPNTTPSSDPNWKQTGNLLKAAELIVTWIKSLNLKDAKVYLLQDGDHTPFIFTDIAATRKNDDRTILFYSHFDKMPATTGWDEGKGATKPVIENGRLYGRGTADDGYASFSVFTAVKCCQDHGVPLPRICITIEGCEESGEEDLRYYFLKLKPIFGNVALFVCMDAGCEDYKRLWVTTTLRGTVQAKVTVNTLSLDLNANLTSGVVPDNYLIMRTIIDALQNEKGEILVPELNLPEDLIPPERVEQCKKVAEIKGEQYKKDVPLYEETEALQSDIYQLVLNKCWRPCLTVIGADGIPKFEDSGNVMKPNLSFQISFRLPPHVDCEKAKEAIDKKIKESIPFNANVQVDIPFCSNGWDLNTFSKRIENTLNNGSKSFFGNELCYRGEGGSIPFVEFFQEHFPKADLANLGIAGMDCNEHGPNESLDLDACKKFIMTLAYLMSEY